MKRSLKLLMSALTALVVPALGWAVTVDASTGLPTMDNYTAKTQKDARITEDLALTKSTFLAFSVNCGSGENDPPNTAAINATGYDLAIGRGTLSGDAFTATTNSYLNFSNAITANSLYIVAGQFGLINGTELANAGDLYVAGQLFVRPTTAVTLENNIYLTRSSYNGDDGHGALVNASVRLNGALTLSGTVTLLGSEQILIGTHGSAGTLTLGGTLDVSKVATAGNATALLKFAGCCNGSTSVDFADASVINLPENFIGTLKLIDGTISNFEKAAIKHAGNDYTDEYKITRDASSGTIVIAKASDLVSKTLNGPTSATALAIEDGKIVTLTADADSSIDMDAAITVAELKTAGSNITFTGANGLTSGLTTIGANTDVSAIDASLGTVTIVDDKTLTVGALSDATKYNAATTSTVEMTADTTYDNTRDSSIKNLLITNGKLTSSYTSGGAGIATGRTITIDGAAEGSTAELAITTGDGTGYDNGIGSKIVIKNGAKLCYGSRDTLKTAIELMAGKVELTAEAGNNGRVLDLYNNHDSVADFTVKAAEGATADDPTISYIDCLGTGIHRAIHMRAGVVEFKIEENALLEIDGYLVDNAGGGTSSSMKKTGAGVMTLIGNDASSCTIPVAIEAGAIKLCDKATLGTSEITVTGSLVYSTSDASVPTNTIKGAGVITADGCTLDLSKATLTDFTGSYSVTNGGTLILPNSQLNKTITVTDGTLKFYVTEEQMLEGVTVENVTLPTEGNIVFILPTGVEVVGTGTELPSQQVYTYKATVEGDNKWSTVANWKLNGADVTSAPAGEIDIPVVLDLPEETTFYVDVEGLDLSSLIVDGGELFLSEKPLTIGFLSSTHKVKVYNTLTIDALGTEVTPTLVSNVIEVENGGKLITKGYLNCSAANTILSGGTLEIASGVTTFNLAGTGLSGTLKVAEGATCKNGTNDGPNWNGSPILDIAGTLEITGTARWSLPANTKTTLREGAVLKGVGGTEYNYAYDWFGGAEITVEGNATIEGNVGSHNAGTLTFNVADSKTLTLSGKYDGGTYSGAAKLKVIGTGTLKLTNTNTYTGGTEIAAGATLHAETPDALGGEGNIAIAGTLKFAKASAFVNAFNRSAWGRMSGTGTVEFADGQWYSIASIPTTLKVVNNNESNGVVIYRSAENYNQDTTIGTLSGSGWFRSDLGDIPRSLIIVQSANSEFSGDFTSYKAAEGRLMNVKVMGAEGATEKTLTLSGESTYDTDVNGLSIDATGSVNLTGTWNGNVTNNGILAGTGKIGGTLTLADGAIIDATSGALTVTGAVTLPTEGTVTIDVTGLAADATILICDTSTLDLENITLTGVADDLLLTVNDDETALVLVADDDYPDDVTVPGTTTEEEFEAAWDLLVSKFTTEQLEAITEITNPDAATIINGCDVDLDETGKIATLTYEFKVTEITMDAEGVKVKVELGKNELGENELGEKQTFATDVIVTLVDLEGAALTGVTVVGAKIEESGKNEATVTIQVAPDNIGTLLFKAKAAKADQTN